MLNSELGTNSENHIKPELESSTWSLSMCLGDRNNEVPPEKVLDCVVRIKRKNSKIIYIIKVSL